MGLKFSHLNECSSDSALHTETLGHSGKPDLSFASIRGHQHSVKHRNTNPTIYPQVIVKYIRTLDAMQVNGEP